MFYNICILTAISIINRLLIFVFERLLGILVEVLQIYVGSKQLPFAAITLPQNDSHILELATLAPLVGGAVHVKHLVGPW